MASSLPDPSGLGCSCPQYAPHEAIQLWNARALPILQRMMSHGHGVDTTIMDKTLELLMKMESGHPDCYAQENLKHSHHLPGCRWHPRYRDHRAPTEADKAAAYARKHAAALKWSACSPLSAIFSTAPRP